MNAVTSSLLAAGTLRYFGRFHNVAQMERRRVISSSHAALHFLKSNLLFYLWIYNSLMEYLLSTSIPKITGLVQYSRKRTFLKQKIFSWLIKFLWRFVRKWEVEKKNPSAYEQRRPNIFLINTHKHDFKGNQISLPTFVKYNFLKKNKQKEKIKKVICLYHSPVPRDVMAPLACEREHNIYVIFDLLIYTCKYY